MNAKTKLLKKFDEDKHICVGLDTDINKIPEHLRKNEDAVYEFNKTIIENTHDLAAAYKINFAFYEQQGTIGFDAMKKTLELIPEDILTIGDAKRGDIGNTSNMYAKAVFDEFQFDSVTLHPYMGFDSISPFLDYEEKLNFILALTSNKGASDFEKLKLENGTYFYQTVIEKISEWNDKGNCGIVFGATQLEELKTNLNRFNELFVLLPGVGAQGGSFEDVVTCFHEAGNNNYLVNISRGIIYAGQNEDFGIAARNVLQKYNFTLKGLISAKS